MFGHKRATAVDDDVDPDCVGSIIEQGEIMLMILPSTINFDIYGHVGL